MDTNIIITDNAVSIGDNRGQIAYWERADWISDPTVPLFMAMSIATACQEGPDKLRELMEI